MAKLTTYAETGKITEAADFMKIVSQFLLEIQPIINGKIEFESNILSQVVTSYFPTANVDLVIPHALGKTPIRYLVADKTRSCDVYRGSKVETKDNVFLKSTVAGVTVTLILF